MKVELDLTDAEYERFVRIFQDYGAPSHERFVMRGVDFLDKLRYAKEKIGCRNKTAILLVRNPGNKYEEILEKY